MIGGTGTMGGPLVDILYQKGFHVSVVCRKEKDDKRQIDYHYGDAKKIDFIKGVLRPNYDSVIDFCMYSPDEFERNYKILLESTKQYICLSSAAVYADSYEPKVESSPRYMETDPPMVDDVKYNWYCYEKARIEDILKESGKRNWTIVRPGITVNRYHIGWGLSWNEDWFLRIVQGKKVVVEKDMLPFKASFSYGGHVAQMIAGLVCNDKALGETYNVASSEEFSWQELLDLYIDKFSRLGYEMKIKYVKSAELIKRHPGKMYVYQRARLLDRRFDSSKVYAFIGESNFSPSLSELLDLWMSEIVKNRKTPSCAVRKMAETDRFTGDVSSKNDFYTNFDFIKYYILRFFPVISSVRKLGRRIVRKLIIL